MSNTIKEEFEEREAESIALSVKCNRWSRTMIELMIREQEQKLVASDQPVDGEEENDFWSEIG